MTTHKHTLLALASLMLAGAVQSREITDFQGKKKTSVINTIASSCSPATAQTDLDINNVRTTILSGGDMWWDLSTAKYEIPKGGKAHSIFAGSLWIGGIDDGNNLKVAAMTYRQNGNDFWPGPLDVNNVSVDAGTCSKYDRHFKITRKEVEDFYEAYKNGFGGGYVIPKSILEWPGNGDVSKGQAKYLAPFFDNDGDGMYDPYAGDYPDYNITGSTSCSSNLYGDGTLWWVFNDRGDIHGETQAEPIGLEIHAQAFGFTTNDEINNMTFYNYKIINRSKSKLTKTYFGAWVDTDLGYFDDDFVGCDVSRGLGFCYNGLPKDGSGAVGTYGNYPPVVGVDFFEGPFADPNGKADPITPTDANSANGIGYGDNIVDNERLGMSKFVYYNNNPAAVTGDPTNPSHFYNYLSGFWKDGTPFTYGGTGYGGATACNFMFPGDSDPQGFGTGGQIKNDKTWSEHKMGNKEDDRRFLQSAGPFTLLPGAVNKVTTGVVWAQSTQLGNLAAIPLMKLADDKAQALFNNCFNILNGPDAPDLAVQELDKEVLLYISNKGTSNNFQELYSEIDPLIIDTAGQFPRYDSTFEFEGYQIFQLREPTVSVTDIHNPDKARLVAQCDVKNGIKQLVNLEYSAYLNANIPQEEVNGADLGIQHSFRITEDQFSSSTNKNLVNHKTYYYMAIAYGYNRYKDYDANNAAFLDGQKKPYKAGRRNIKVYSAIPHIPSPEANGTLQHSTFGDGPVITRIEGQGNGGCILDLTSETVSRILASADGRVKDPSYENTKGPVSIKVIDPLNVPEGNFEIKFSGSATSAVVSTSTKWTLTQIGGSLKVGSDKTIQVGNEQLIPQLGISIKVNQVGDLATTTPVVNNGGFMEGTISFGEETKRWLTGLADVDGYSPRNWIRSGNQKEPENSTNQVYLAFEDFYTGPSKTPTFVDQDAEYEQVLGGTWAPYRLCAYPDANLYARGAPAWKPVYYGNTINELASIDLVLTPDTSKWTRSVVLEMQEETALAEGGALRLDSRKSPSVDKLFRTVSSYNDPNDPKAPNYISATGMSWFPGYAINTETGERLNIAFGEDSWQQSENGRDMKWNPTSTIYSGSNFEPRFGGRHYIYIFGHNSDLQLSGTLARVPRYDAGRHIRTYIDNPQKKGFYVMADAMWVNIPLATEGYDLSSGIPPCEAKVRLRVNKPYRTGYSTTLGTDSVSGSLNKNMPMYRFSTSGLQAVKSDNETAKDALALSNVVPNPYYAYSAYETNQLDNRIKVTNLPENCTVTIYTLSGTLIKRIKKSDPKTSVDWDLKNDAGIPVASGLYIIHVDAPGVGEKVLKWFGVMRPTDLDSF